eukprot:4792617-Amphidinium_carterae.1
MEKPQPVRKGRACVAPEVILNKAVNKCEGWISDAHSCCTAAAAAGKKLWFASMCPLEASVDIVGQHDAEQLRSAAMSDEFDA